MKDKLKEAYQRWCKETRRNGSTLVGGSVYEFFEWLDESKQDGWVSVEERLPDFDVKVLVWGEAKGMNPQMGGAYQFITTRRDIAGKFDRMLDSNKFYAAYVTHWRPLPAPPSTDKQ
jgi:hypothetical protein